MNIKPDLQKLQEAYLNDPFIKDCLMNIANAYAKSIPSYQIINNELKPVYPENTEKYVNSIKELMNSHVVKYYSDLLGAAEPG